METTVVHWGYIGLILGKMEKNMETTTASWGYVRVMLGKLEKNMETTGKNMETTVAYWGYIGDNGKDHGNYYSTLGLYRVVLGKWKRI